MSECATASAWIRCAPSLTNISPTTDLPLAMPPVRPSFSNGYLRPAQLGVPDSTPQHCGFYRVGHQHRNSHRADASGDGRDRPSDFGDLGVYVANQDRASGQKRFFTLFVSRKEAVQFLSVGDLVDTDIAH